MATAAKQVTLSTGQILFADPSLPWAPTDFPNLPSTALSITANGTIAGRNISQLSFSNAITYENFQSPPLRPSLIKSLVINSVGDVGYDDPKVSLVSTALTAYQIGLTGFGSAAIGAPGIQSSPPDTLTNAIAKLDGWITEGLLKQPPSVSLADIEETSLYAGVRWNNFNVYNILQYSLPYTSGIVIMLGDPTTANYLTLELTKPDWFPDRQYVDGLASDFYPIVRLRIFKDFFLPSADEMYSKAALPAGCVKIIGESGIYTLPSAGKVFAVENSVAGETYTTANIYLPQLSVGQIIPVRIIYINKTQSSPNIFTTQTTITSFGAPSKPSSIIQTLSTPTSFTLRVGPPVYADATHLVSSCYLSSYNIEYTATRMNTAHSGDLGFRYGEALPATLPYYLSNYTNSTLTKITPVQGGLQDIEVVGSGASAVQPGIQWSTSTYATNSAYLIGSTLGGPTAVSAFPVVTTQNISSASIQFTSPWVVHAGPGGLSYIQYSNGWNLRDPISTSVVFLGSTQVTSYRLNAPVQFNDKSYPGCRSNVTMTAEFKDIDGVPQTLSVTRAAVADDFTLGVPQGASANDSFLSTILSDSQISVPFQKFFYDATLTGARAFSTVSYVPQSLNLTLDNFEIAGFNDPIIAQTLSTHIKFMTENDLVFHTSSLIYTNHVTSTVQISGMYTPTTGSRLAFDLYSSNFVQSFANYSSFAMGQLYFNSQPAGQLTKYTSSVFVYNGATQVTTLPFPVNTPLHISSSTVPLSERIYMDPADPRSIEIYASVTPANPIDVTPLIPFGIASTMFIDTVSATLYSTFTNMNTSNGMRVLSLLPHSGLPGTQYDMNDGIDANGTASNGLNVCVSSFFIMNYSNDLFVSSSVVYNNTSSISSVYTNFYSRELLFTNGSFTHPGGLDFCQFNGTPLGAPTAIYPNFTTDLAGDVNYGNRYASFLFFSKSNAQPTSYQFANIRVRNPSALSTITDSRDFNYAFPDTPIPDSNLQYSKVRMHVKILGAYNDGTYTPLETEWINCFKTIDYGIYNDSIYDIGGCVSASTSGADIWYKVQVDRRYFTSIYPIIRVGISRDGSAEVLPANSDYLPITFDGINVEMTNA